MTLARSAGSRVATSRRGTGATGTLGALCLLVATGVPAVADHAPSQVGVAVAANAFDPFETVVQPGGTVTWNVREGGHTIVADDGRFDFRGDDGTGLASGSERSFIVGSEQELVRYHCSIHGGPGGIGMAGALVIGHPAPVLDDVTIIRVPQDADLAGAVAAARPGTRIEVAPGRHTLENTLQVHLRDEGELPRGVTIVGTGEQPSDVRVDVAFVPQRGAAPAVIHVTGAFATLANLTVLAEGVRSSGAAMHLDGANQVALVDVVVDGGGIARDGIRIGNASGAALHRVQVRGARHAGLDIGPCAACGVRVEESRFGGATVGVLATGAAGIIVRDSLIEANAAGIVARRQGSHAASITAAGNEIRANTKRDGLPAITTSDRLLATGAGVWLDGVVDSRIEKNFVDGNQFGIVATGWVQSLVVTGNAVAGNAVDLGWDGLGVNACFSGNDGVATSSPPSIAALYPCSRVTVGVPWPPLTVALFAAAHS